MLDFALFADRGDTTELNFESIPKRGKLKKLVVVLATVSMLGTSMVALSLPAGASQLCTVNSTYSTGTVEWNGISCTSGNLNDATVLATGNGDAYDSWGQVSALDTSGTRQIITGSVTKDDFPEITYKTTNFDRAGGVDIFVTRKFYGNTITWEIKVFATGTSNPVAIPLFIEGNLGSDSGTFWTLSNDYWVSTDSGSGTTLSYDPAIIFVIPSDATFETRADNNDDVRIDLKTVASATVRHVLVGWESGSCRSYADVMAYVDELTSSIDSAINADLPELSLIDGACSTNWEGNRVLAYEEPTFPSSKVPTIRQLERGFMVVTPGSNAKLSGPRLDCTTLIWVNDAAVPFTSALQSDGTYELNFAVPSLLASGFHTLKIDSCAGIVIYENALLVSKPNAVFTSSYVNLPEIWLNLVAMRKFINQNRADFNSVECVAQTSTLRESARANLVIQRYCMEAFSRLALGVSGRSILETGFSGPGTKITITLSNR